MAEQKPSLGKLAVVGLLILLPVIGLATLMPTLQSAKKTALRERLGGAPAAARTMTIEEELDGEPRPAADKPTPLRAIVKKYDAEISLTPRLSVGTATPESIYVAEFKATIEAQAPGDSQGKCHIELPLPPQIISLADVDLKVDGEASEDFALAQNRLVWRGPLDASRTSEITVAYSATGKGVYTLEKPSGKIIEHFRTKLIAKRSNIRMLELSLQPNELEQSSDDTTYTWEYNRLVLARPIAIDVLGIAAIDRLGELTWLGPVSVLVFGILVALIALARDPEKLNGWLVLLVVGCFAGAYPMMYFLQDFISLGVAIVLAAAGVIVVIAWRIMSLFGVRHGLFGGVIAPGIIMALTIAATIHAKPAMQGVLLTIMGIFGLVAAMVLLPKAQGNLTGRKGNAAADS